MNNLFGGGVFPSHYWKKLEKCMNLVLRKNVLELGLMVNRYTEK